jgi:hypothetical protein
MKTSIRLILPVLGLEIFNLSAVIAEAGDFTYATNNGTIAIVKYTGPGGDVTIPSTVNGLPVTSIWGYAFQNCSSLTNITIPSSVTDIGFDAFRACTNLLVITVDALNDTYCSVDGVLFDKSQILLILYPAAKVGSYTISNGVAYIAGAAFSYCSRLTSVTIPNSVTSIGTYAFADCPSLTGVYFQGNPPSIGADVFYNSNKATVYYLAGATGWGSTFAGRPTALWGLASPVILTTAPSFSIQTNGFVFTISGATSLSVAVEACTSLANPTWLPLSTNTLTGGSSNFCDPEWKNHPARFYRVRSL